MFTRGRRAVIAKYFDLLLHLLLINLEVVFFFGVWAVLMFASDSDSLYIFCCLFQILLCFLAACAACLLPLRICNKYGNPLI